MSTTVVGIIGSGNIGKGVARMATAAGLRVVLANSRGPESLTEVVDSLGELASADSVEGAIAQADTVVLAVPFGALSELPIAALSGKVLIDAMNYYPGRDANVTVLDEHQQTSSAYLAEHLPGARVVKGLNNVDFVRLPLLTRPAGSAERTALPVAADDAEAKAQAIAFLDTLGYDVVDAGTLADSWRSEPGTPIYVAPYFSPLAEHANDPGMQFMTAIPVSVPTTEAEALLAAAKR